jgi:L-ascorbate metabolism protein UlaG (beta-lactamase superfamily)
MSRPAAATQRPRLVPAASDAASRLVAPTTENRERRLLLWWLGQAGFALRLGEQLLLIDPYLSDSLREKHADGPYRHERLVPVPVEPDELTACTWLLCTHGHTDHMDPVTIAGIKRASNPQVLVPRAEAFTAYARGVHADALRTIDADEQLDLATDISVEAVASAHEKLETDAEGRHRFLGYVISVGGMRLYHSGDCVPYAGLAERLASLCVDVALLPVNGRDQRRLRRGVPGNFTPREAAQLCREAGIPTLVAHHIGMFAFNSADPDAVRAELEEHGAGVHAQLLELGTPYEIHAREDSP